ncbi:hypothetical protein OOK31_23990 [Streptomyces sp. NBC_00249]|uniref:hypothetical protein n=1 Tax=Streptomyces sp. NBC_00249 TaxID=2975690 RepID=UPI002250B12A|nr:hypothetical protein [Streptomyces sp. NBC_00249]MCX5196919.1 hypothetical protein [Streptomyces sp. NBC_00249]
MSESRTRAPMRATRAAMFAAVCVALGAVGHSYMSGMDIPVHWLLGAFAATCAAAWTAAGRRCGPLGITAALLSAQGMLHLAFSASGAHAATVAPAPHLPASVPEPMPGHHHVQGMAMPMPMAGTGSTGGGATSMPGMEDMAGMAGMAGHGGLGMIAAHVLAGLFCAVWLARGEAAVFRLAEALGAVALLAARPLTRALTLLRTRVAPRPAPPAHLPPYVRPRRLRGAVHAHTAVRRGPPPGRSTRTTAPRPCHRTPARPAAPTAHHRCAAGGHRRAASHAYAPHPAGAGPTAHPAPPARAA